MSVGWSFQIVTDGSFQGFNEPGIAHFKGDRYGNLAREIIQNSLDAAANETGTVYVEFNLQKIPPDKIPGFAEFVKHVEMCAAE